MTMINASGIYYIFLESESNPFLKKNPAISILSCSCTAFIFCFEQEMK